MVQHWTNRKKMTSLPPDRYARVHENLTLLEAESPAQLEDLKALPEVRAALVRNLTQKVAVLDASRLPELLAVLEKHGYLPSVLGKSAD